MENIVYSIIKKDDDNVELLNTEPFDMKFYTLDLYNDNIVKSYNSDELFMLYMSYNVKSLVQILNYYGINKNNINNKKKLVKDEMIQLLIIFELDENNTQIVNKRRRLWQNISELSSDVFFKNFVTFTV